MREIQKLSLHEQAMEAVEQGEMRYQRALCHAASSLKSDSNLSKAIDEFKDLMYREPRDFEIKTIQKWGK
jgi:hypothetical protein